MNKYIVGDMVAVLYSPGFGAGWYTWNQDIPECLFDPAIVQMVLDEEDHTLIQSVAKDKWPVGYWGGADDLCVRWMPRSTQFQIEEYDGNESFRFTTDQWMVA